MHAGWLAAILNLLEMGGGDGETPFTLDTVCPLAVPLYARTELAAPLFARTDLPVPLYAREPLEVPMPGCRNEV